ncbi:STAS domain-containing protein [Aquihabitans daechungensis]|uniref:STAS domain-containing protein n=1 Tax=Aquihabitans daechungensis TaxID=1052257 RepID=UPI003BA1DFC9
MDVTVAQITMERRTDEVIVHPYGDVDTATAGALSLVLDQAMMQGRRVVVDLEDVTFIDARGIATVLEAAQTLTDRGGGLGVRAASATVARVFEQLGGEIPLDSISTRSDGASPMPA